MVRETLQGLSYNGEVNEGHYGQLWGFWYAPQVYIFSKVVQFIHFCVLVHSHGTYYPFNLRTCNVFIKFDTTCDTTLWEQMHVFMATMITISNHVLEMDENVWVPHALQVYPISLPPRV